MFSKHRIAVAAAAAATILLAGTAAVSAGTTTAPAGPMAAAAATTAAPPPITAADTLDFARHMLALCQVQLHDASDSAARTRAQNCITDAQRAIADLTRVPPTPTPSASATGSPTGSPTPSILPTSASPTPVPTSASPTPTPSPTPTGGGFPNAGNTGVPAGTTLTPYTGSCTISTPGTILFRVLISSSKCAQVKVITHDVLFRESEIDAQVSNDENNSTSFSLVDSTVRAGIIQAPAVLHTHLTVIRSNISGGQTSVSCVEACNVSDSWLHGQIHDPAKADQHFGGFLSNGGGSVTAQSVIQHNTIACDVPETTVGGGISSCSGDVNLYGDFGGVHYYSFINNLLVAPDRCTTNDCPGTPSYCAYGGTGKAGAPDHVVFEDNVFQRGLPGNGGGAHCGWWGAATSFDVSLPGDIWTGNHFQDNGEVIPAPGP